MNGWILRFSHFIFIHSVRFANPKSKQNSKIFKTKNENKKLKKLINFFKNQNRNMQICKYASHKEQKQKQNMISHNRLMLILFNLHISLFWNNHNHNKFNVISWIKSSSSNDSCFHKTNRNRKRRFFSSSKNVSTLA